LFIFKLHNQAYFYHILCLRQSRL